jgi:hypothetical protein
MMPHLIALDANVLLLLVVGLTNPAYIPSHKRLRSYTFNDFKTLSAILEQYDEAIVIPNALSETSNLIRHIGEPARGRIYACFRQLIQNTREDYVRSRDASGRDEFIRLGLTDSAFLEVAKQDILLLSADGHLVRAAQAAGYRAENFFHLTEAASA